MDNAKLSLATARVHYNVVFSVSIKCILGYSICPLPPPTHTHTHTGSDLFSDLTHGYDELSNALSPINTDNTRFRILGRNETKWMMHSVLKAPEEGRLVVHVQTLNLFIGD